jgi:hypothetical protein
MAAMTSRANQEFDRHQSIFHQAPPQSILGKPLFIGRGVPAIPFLNLFSQKRATPTCWQNTAFLLHRIFQIKALQVTKVNLDLWIQ